MTDINLENKYKIIEMFMKNVKGKTIEIKCKNKKHDGKEGHWLETQFGIIHNDKNEPDLLGYEMKKSSTKITFGDFSANEYLFSNQKKYIMEYNDWKDIDIKITKNDFIRYFGNQNPHKNNRYSWSGRCFPKYNEWNECGQIIHTNEQNDICIFYSFERDRRDRKESFPEFLKGEKDILIAYWNHEKLRNHIEKKFNHKGFFICKKIKNTYEKICFGKPFTFEYFMENFKNKNIIIDSGMYMGNTRNYSHFRSTANNFWNHLIVEEFESNVFQDDMQSDMQPHFQSA